MLFPITPRGSLAANFIDFHVFPRKSAQVRLPIFQCLVVSKKKRFSEMWMCHDLRALIWSHAVINFTKMVYHTDGRPQIGTSGDQPCIPTLHTK